MILELHTDHARTFDGHRFVYPVLSRRSGGISVGINLNPDKICNFDCVYCQVDRTRQAETRFVAIDQLLTELGLVLDAVVSGQLFQSEKFAATPAALRRLTDIAFSGDGEPTTYRNFDQLVASCAAVKSARGLNDIKMVLITNASMFHRPRVRRALALLDAHRGEVWAKLDAGTEDYFQRVDRTPIPFRQILDNITWAARQYPIVIQSLFLRLDGEPPASEEVAAYCQRLRAIQSAGGSIRLVQVYTVARPPAEAFVSPLAPAEVDAIAAQVRSVCHLPTEAYYGAVS